MNTHLRPRPTTHHGKTAPGLTHPYDQEIFLEPRLLDLVRLRVAQICHCQLCIDLHAEELTDQGESINRIRDLPLWRNSGLYTERERTALAIAEALGSIPPKPVSKAVVSDARIHFNDAEILHLTLTIFAVNDSNHTCMQIRF